MRPPLQTAGFGNIGLSLLSMFQVVSSWPGNRLLFTGCAGIMCCQSPFFPNCPAGDSDRLGVPAVPGDGPRWALATHFLHRLHPAAVLLCGRCNCAVNGSWGVCCRWSAAARVA